jgi:hypothetical protein
MPCETIKLAMASYVSDKKSLMDQLGKVANDKWNEAKDYLTRLDAAKSAQERGEIAKAYYRSMEFYGKQLEPIEAELDALDASIATLSEWNANCQ